MPKFEAFIQNTLWPRAKAAGISRELFDAAFEGITEPDPAVLKLAANQPEFTSTTSDYLAKAVTPIRIETGQTKKAEEEKLLAAIEKKYGVDRHILLGIWGMESNFGKDKGSMSVIRSLATLAYSGRRKDYGNEQLIAAFKILQEGHREAGQFHRLLGRRHGAHAVHPDLLSFLCRGLDGRRQEGHLELQAGRAGLHRQLPRQGRLEDRTGPGAGR